MGALTFDALLRSLKQGASDPVYYLYGDEDVLKDEAVRALIDRAVDPAARDFNVDQRSAAEVDAEAFHALVNTPPMLAATRAVVVRGLEQLKKTAKLRQELLRYLQSPNPTTLLVLVQAAGEPPDPELVRRTTAVAVEPLPPARVERWMAHRARQLALTLAPEAGALLLDAVGSDLAAPARELEKLAAPAGGGGGPGARGGGAGPGGGGPGRQPPALGALGRAVERARAGAGLAARARCGPGPQVQHADRRGGYDRPTGAVIRGAAGGGGLSGGRVAAALFLSALTPIRLAAQQPDTLRAVALRVAQTRPDSGRAMMRRLLASLSPQDSLYPGALFTAGGVAPGGAPVCPQPPRWGGGE